MDRQTDRSVEEGWLRSLDVETWLNNPCLQLADAVHEKGCFIYLQLIALGRAADHDILNEEDPSLPYIAASDVPLTGKPNPPRPLTVPGKIACQ